MAITQEIVTALRLTSCGARLFEFLF
uniref:Uncharacterized protein n=1 Tax=Tetranychus urticae TaxID=32264 RepID=T1KRT8_TETUR